MKGTTLTKFELQIIADHLYNLLSSNAVDVNKVKRLLKLRSTDGTSVAHVLSSMGFFFSLPEHRDIVLLEDRYKNTVAHVMAENGFVFDVASYPDIVSKENVYGKSVLDIMNDVHSGLRFSKDDISRSDFSIML